MFKINDLVVVKEDNKKIVYKIKELKEDSATLSGYIYRIIITKKLNDLEHANNIYIEKEQQILNSTYNQLIKETKTRIRQKAIFGTILHIDGDKEFLDNCINLYKEMNIYAWGIHLKEKDVKTCIADLIADLRPNIVVITGHDYYNGNGIKDLNNYENSKHFIETLKVIRRSFNTDSLTIIIGACSSHFEALIANGANFASSPKRINIHTYDPAIIAIKCATTSCNKTVNFENILKYIENGRSAYGGIETKGNMKLLL